MVWLTLDESFNANEANWQQFQAHEYTDCSISFKNGSRRTFDCHKIILSAVSPYFNVSSLSIYCEYSLMVFHLPGVVQAGHQRYFAFGLFF
jgi:hypothetical protein